MDIVIGVLLIAAALFLVVAVLLQSGKDKSLSGAIAGGSSSDTFYGKNKGKDRDSILSKLTVVVAIIFALLVLVSFIIQDDGDMQDLLDQMNQTTAETTTAAVTTAETEETEETGETEEIGETEANE